MAEEIRRWEQSIKGGRGEEEAEMAQEENRRLRQHQRRRIEGGGAGR